MEAHPGTHASMHNPIIVKIGDSAQGGADEIAGVGLEVRPLPTYPIKQLSAER